MKFDPEKLAPYSTKPAIQAAIRQLVGFVNADDGWQDLRHVAYLLATIQHETAGTFAPIKEYRARAGSKGRANQDRYWLTGYYGRGYVQITWEKNYRKLSRRIGLGETLVKDPDAALRPSVAYRIAADGMREGLFTGHDLDDHINATKCDYVNARRIINGTDKAAEIATIARHWEKRLRAAEVKDDQQITEQINRVLSSPANDTTTEKANPAGDQDIQLVEEIKTKINDAGDAVTSTVSTLTSVVGKSRDSVKAFRTLISMGSFGAMLASVGVWFQDNPLFASLIFVGILIVALFGWKYMTRQQVIAVERTRKQ